ncbi:hypothetical protein GCM10022421_12370 [Oceanisphaera sediminis]|uniref:DUF7033 domain-containing protein n=1 Tax=Oceanisphaera sediminis TaxID=981381 RepID=A0ABP7DN95_9GAMM
MFFSQAALSWLGVLLQERFGHEFILVHENNSLRLHHSTAVGQIIFDNLFAAFHQSSSDFPCREWNAEAEGYQPAIDDLIPVPGLAALPSRLIEHKEQGTVIHYDILGLTYWMLSRLEEVGRTDLDNHQRFPAASSHAYKHGYLERPIVDEWLHILGQVIQEVWPQLVLKQHQFSMRVSHDVDAPSQYGFKSWSMIARMMAGHLLKRHDIKSFVTAPYVKLATRTQLNSADPYNTFDWLMDVSEANNLKSAFYFICGGNHPNDGEYQPEHPVIRNLMRRIHQRGHEIGLHPSYGTYQNPELIKQEAERLHAVMQKEGIIQNVLGGRMHYLRWEQPTTLQAWNDAGMSYETTLSYADRPGFRCGTCFEYQAFNPVTQKILDIRIRPLIAMECTVIDSVYLGLGITDNAQNKFLELKDKCRKLGGCFTLLWHNSYFDEQKAFKQIYKRCIEG